MSADACISCFGISADGGEVGARYWMKQVSKREKDGEWAGDADATICAGYKFE